MTYHYGGIDFLTLGAIKTHIQGVIDYKNRVIEREFFDDVLADVVVDRHYRWSHKKIRPTSFKFMASTQGDGRTWSDSLAGFFPGYGWRRFSYRKALRKKPVTLETEFPRLLRERWVRKFRDHHIHGAMRCALCIAPPTDVDHIEPQHSQLVTLVWALVDSETEKKWWNQICQQSGENHFVLPDDHSAIQKYDQWSQEGKYQALCKACHRKVTTKRKAKVRSWHER